jgi:hypothetical protein
MGALTIPMFFHGLQVVSGDVLRLVPRGVRGWFGSPFLGIVDLRDRSIPYLRRFGGALNLNVHFRALVLDGVFHREQGRQPAFLAARRLSEGDLFFSSW